MITIIRIENFEKEVKGFNYISFNNIENFKSKLRSIGLNEDFISSRISIYLFLISYLCVMTKEQLCALTDLLESDIRTAINWLNNNTDYGNTGFLIDVENYGNDKDTVYYTSTKKAFANLMSFTDEDNIRTVKIKQNKRHLSKTNDFYLSLFKNSGCETLTIDYNDIIFHWGKLRQMDLLKQPLIVISTIFIWSKIIIQRRYQQSKGKYKITIMFIFIMNFLLMVL